MIKGELAHRAEQLVAEREPFVYATVVRTMQPTSVRAGDTALVLRNGDIDGFVGGVCAQSSVRLYAVRALETGEALLLRLEPGVGPVRAADGAAGDEGATAAAADMARDGVVVAHNPCLSGGSLEIFLDPQLPAARLVIAGDMPIARALEDIARAASYDVVRGTADEVAPAASDAALIVASHGEDEELVLARALAAGVPYVGLVASPKRGAAVLAALDVPDALRSLVHTPAGLDIGARLPAEVAISILAEVVALRGVVQPPAPVARALPMAPPPAGPPIAIDPICGMEVVATEASVHLDVDDGERVYFCRDGCRTTYVERRQHPAQR
jgi:xanthine dehydrogenase accessory factor